MSLCANKFIPATKRCFLLFGVPDSTQIALKQREMMMMMMMMMTPN